MMPKVFDNYEEYLFPYLKSPKYATVLEDGIAKGRQGGAAFKNFLHVFECYLTGKTAFKDSSYDRESHINELNTKLQLLTQQTSSDLLEHVTSKN